MVGIKKFIIFWKWIKNLRKELIIWKSWTKNCKITRRKWTIKLIIIRKKYGRWTKIIAISWKKIEYTRMLSWYY